LAARPASRRDAQEVSRLVIGSALKVHTALGAGLLESAYEACLAYELRQMGCLVQTQVQLPIEYRGVKVDAGYRLDMLIDDLVIVELKCVDSISAIHKAQIISYLKLSGKSLGLILNFHVVHLRDGIKRFVRGQDWKAPAPS
jgi:GxxExxY protein